MRKGDLLKSLLPAFILIMQGVNPVRGQEANTPVAHSQTRMIFNSSPAIKNQQGVFGNNHACIENIGQYGTEYTGYKKSGKILFGYEGFDMPVLFTETGVIHLQQKKEKRKYKYEEEEKREKHNDIAEKLRTINFEWIGAKHGAEVKAEGRQENYYTYGLLRAKAYAYTQITYREMYPGIDVVYSFTGQEAAGYEYSLVVKPGADLGRVKLRITGDLKSVRTEKTGKLIITNDADGIAHSSPVSFYAGSNDSSVKVVLSVKDNVISFLPPADYDRKQTLVIDPFVAPLTSLTGFNNNIGKDIDFDYAGNVYVSGGGDGSAQKLAKYSSAGTLLWTFSGTLAVPVWTFGTSYGGWVVDKVGGGVYLGQGLSGGGFSVVRLDASGIYDNYITNPSSNFTENWKMTWSCHGGIPKILIAGGGGSADNELAILPTGTSVLSPSNLSGLSGGHNDISDIVIDPATDDMYTIYSIPVTSAVPDNLIYKHPPPYTSGGWAWKKATGYFALREPANRPYLTGLDNSSNTLAVNANYLFYWDGKNLVAYNKADGSVAGNPFTFSSNTALQQGGIYADECNNVYIGFTNGVIKILKFDGTAFNDGTVPPITIAGFSSSSVFDLAYDNAHDLLYACGNGFVASFNIAGLCPSTTYTLNINEDCFGSSAAATLNPVPPAGTQITYVLFDGLIQVATNTTGVFSGLTPGISYTLKVFLNKDCSGIQVVKSFTVQPVPGLSITDPPPVCLPDGTRDLTDPAITAGSTPGFTFTYWKDALATVLLPNPAAAIAGTYYIKGSLGPGCFTIKPVVIPSLPVPVAAAGPDIGICSGEDTQLSASPGAVGYSWSPVTYLDNPHVPDPHVINPLPGVITYHLTITDQNGCRSQADEQVVLTVKAPVKIGIVTDTVAAINEPLQFNAIDKNKSGIIQYTWTPAAGLSNASVHNPVAVLTSDMRYKVTGSTAEGCEGSAIVNVKVYAGPEIYVPSAFTPTGDGRNDIFKPIAVGIKTFNYFRIYNRWGELVFASANPSVGWDGTVSGKPQGAGVFVWMVSGKDFKGRTIAKKGIVTLIR